MRRSAYANQPMPTAPASAAEITAAKPTATCPRASANKPSASATTLADTAPRPGALVPSFRDSPACWRVVRDDQRGRFPAKTWPVSTAPTGGVKRAARRPAAAGDQRSASVSLDRTTAQAGSSVRMWSSWRRGLPRETSRRCQRSHARPAAYRRSCEDRSGSSRGPGKPRSRESRRGWRRFQPGTNDRSGVATVSVPSGVRTRAITAARGSSSTIITCWAPASTSGNATEPGQPQHLPAVHRKTRQQRDPVGRRAGLFTPGRGHRWPRGYPRSRPQIGAPPHPSRGPPPPSDRRARIVAARSRPLAAQAHRDQAAACSPEPLRVYPVADSAAVQDVERRHPHHPARAPLRRPPPTCRRRRTPRDDVAVPVAAQCRQPGRVRDHAWALSPVMGSRRWRAASARRRRSRRAATWAFPPQHLGQFVGLQVVGDLAEHQ